MSPGVSIEIRHPSPRRVEAPAAASLAEIDRGYGLRLERLTRDGGLRGCLACGHPELFTHRDFPRPVGLGIVALAALLAPVTSYLSLVVAALADALLYRLAPLAVTCYACRAVHRGFHPEPRHPGFDREIEERLRYGDKAVMGKPMREGGTAGAPEPEH